jgi:hypothetical protein
VIQVSGDGEEVDVETATATTTTRERRSSRRLVVSADRGRGRGGPDRRGHPLLRDVRWPVLQGRQRARRARRRNSGLEEGLFLTQFVDLVTIVQRGDRLTANKLLQDKVNTHERMRVL